MNIFGAFTFGSLIKTFLPGFVWLIAIGIVEADISRFHGLEPLLFGYASAHDQAALILTIPASILLGLMSNIVVFMGVNDVLVRNPVKKKNPALFTLHDRLAKELRDRCWANLAQVDASDRAEFDRCADVEIVMLHTIGVDKLAYVREQYWYHLEFQVNLLLSIVVMIAAAIAGSVLGAESISTAIFHAVAYLVVAVPVCWLLFLAARKNYQRHIAKTMSLMAAVLSPPPQRAVD
jgi:hypothetical protein